jgi:hypothetical protein
MQGHSKVLIPVKVLSKPFAVVRQQSYVLVVAETHTKTAPKNPKLNWSIVVVVGDDAQGYSTHHLTSAIAPRSRIVSHPRHLLLNFRGMFVLHDHNSTPAVVTRSWCSPHTGQANIYILAGNCGLTKCSQSPRPPSMDLISSQFCLCAMDTKGNYRVAALDGERRHHAPHQIPSFC